MSDRAFAGWVISRLAAVLCILWLGVAPASADHGRFLQDANAMAQTGINTWGNTGGMANTPHQFDGFVTDNVKNIGAGRFRFDYDTYTRNPGGRTAGGAALSGGFFMSPNVTVKDGYRLTWIQTIIATRTGTEAAMSFNLPITNAGEYPDADPMDRMAPGLSATDPLYAPTYPFNTPAVAPMGMVPTLGFQDFPARFFADGNQSWLAEVGLSCVSINPNLNIGGQMFREVRVANTIIWGFNLNGLPAMMPGIGNVGATLAQGGGGPTPGYLNTLNNFYDGLGGGGRPDGMGGMLPEVATARYRFAANDNCFAVVPEPGTLALCVLVMAFTRVRRRA